MRSVGGRDVVVGLGSNLGSRIATLRAALDLIEAAEDVRVVGLSPFYETEPVGPTQPRFVNAAARVHTPLPLEALLDRTLAVERALGRERRERWGPRLVDLDILWSDGEEVDHDRLTVPHPRLRERAFALAPLLDVLPDAPPELRRCLEDLGGRPDVLAAGSRDPQYGATRSDGELVAEAPGPDADDAVAAALTGIARELAVVRPGRGLECREAGRELGADWAGDALEQLTALFGAGFHVRSAVLAGERPSGRRLRVVGRPGMPIVIRPVEIATRPMDGLPVRSNPPTLARTCVRLGDGWGKSRDDAK